MNRLINELEGDASGSLEEGAGENESDGSRINGKEIAGNGNPMTENLVDAARSSEIANGGVKGLASSVEVLDVAGPGDSVGAADTLRRRVVDREPRVGETGKGIFAWENGEAVEPWPEPVDGVLLLRELSECVSRHVVLSKHAADALALWVVHTYGFQLRDVTACIGIESPQKRCGKTTLLTVLNELVNRPVVASNISSPAFFRVISEKQPTLMIDEADTVLHRNDELRGILNAGYRRMTAYVVRVAYEAKGAESRGRNVEGGGTTLARYSNWCPKAIATIKHLPETLADRCIVIPMHRKKVTEKCGRLKDLDGRELRRKCARFVRDHAEAISTARPEIPEVLNDRAGEIWEPLLAVADLAGGDWPERGRAAAVELAGSGQEESAVGALLFDILVCFASRKLERMFSRDLVAALNEMNERPWSELRRGRRISETWLSRQLRPYDVYSKTMWITGQVAKGYEHGDFNEAFAQYIPKSQAARMLEELVGLPGEESRGEKSKAEIGKAEKREPTPNAACAAELASSGESVDQGFGI